MGKIKDFGITDIGVWIPKKELLRFRDSEDVIDVRDLISAIDKHYENPKNHEDPEMMKLAGELQKRLMQCTIDFFREKDIKDVWSVAWDADDLPSSIKEGVWIPYSDSSINMEKLTENGRVSVAFVI